MTTATLDRQDICARISRRLEERVGPHRYKMWFDRSARFSWDDHGRKLEVAVPNRFVADWIGRHFEHDLRHVAHGEVGEALNLEVCVDPARFTLHDHAATAVPDRAARPAATLVVPDPQPRRTKVSHDPGLRHRFEDFILGPCNELAYAAATRFADEDADHLHPAASGPRTLFIHGGCGLGKTHLLQAVCRRVREHRPDARVLYVTGEQFTNDFLTAIRTNRIDAFRRRLRKLDLLAVDDVQFIANKTATQQEFLHSFDALDLSGARVMLASDNHPKLIRAFSDALVSRCVRGMVVEVHRPDAATRLRIIEAMADRRGLTLVEAVTHALAQRCQGSVRDIEGAITKLHALAHLTASREATRAADDHAVISHQMIDQLFESMPATGRRRIVRFDVILQTTCDQMGLTPAQVLGQGRSRHVVLARAIVVLLAREFTPMSYPEIAAAMGRNNHSTVITAAQRLTRQLQQPRDMVLPGRMEQTRPAELLDRIRDAIARAG